MSSSVNVGYGFEGGCGKAQEQELQLLLAVRSSVSLRAPLDVTQYFYFYCCRGCPMYFVFQSIQPRANSWKSNGHGKSLVA